MKKEDMPLLIKLVKTLEDSLNQFEKAYQEKDTPKFNKSKKDIIQTQRQISEIVK